MDDQQHVKYKEFKEVKDDVRDIKQNHIPHILKEIKNLRWFIFAGMAVLGVVLGILQVFG